MLIGFVVLYGVRALAIALLKSCIEIKFMGQEHDVKNYMTRAKKPIAPRQISKMK